MIRESIIQLDIEKIREETKESKRINTLSLIKAIEEKMENAIDNGRSCIDITYKVEVDKELLDNVITGFSEAGFKTEHNYGRSRIVIEW